jgi:hypothetical protein
MITDETVDLRKDPYLFYEKFVYNSFISDRLYVSKPASSLIDFYPNNCRLYWIVRTSPDLEPSITRQPMVISIDNQYQFNNTDIQFPVIVINIDDGIEIPWEIAKLMLADEGSDSIGLDMRKTSYFLVAFYSPSERFLAICNGKILYHLAHFEREVNDMFMFDEFHSTLDYQTNINRLFELEDEVNYVNETCRINSVVSEVSGSKGALSRKNG